MASEEQKIETPTENGKAKTERTITPIQVTHPEYVDSEAIRLFREPPWVLRLTIEGDRSYLKVRAVCAAPLSQPDRYICLLDEKNEVICTVEDPTVLDAASQQMIKEELNQRYMTAIIKRVDSLKSEYGVSYWEVQTDRGNREFVVRNVSENAQWISDRRLLLVDVDGNRFEISNLEVLDKKSRGLIEMVL
jgi:hypothetical protein